MSGIGLHSGARCTVTLLPAEAGTGIVLARADLPGSPEVRAHWRYITERERRTALLNESCEIHTVEHLLSALRGLQVDNVRVEVDAIELPGMDGSAAEYVNLVQQAGLVEQEASRRVVTLRHPIWHVVGGMTLVALPPSAGEFHVSSTLDYPHPLLKQFVETSLEPETYARDIAPARTFVLEQEARMLQAAGLGKGADTTNTLVMGDAGPVENSLRFPDECARHKVLDLIGDLSLLGTDLRARILSIRSGHAANQALIRQIGEALEKGELEAEG